MRPRCTLVDVILLTVHSSIKYKRMKDKFGTASSASVTPAAEDATPAGDDSEKTPKKKKAPAKTPKSAAKKRKLKDDDDAETTKVKAEDEEDVSFPFMKDLQGMSLTACKDPDRN